MENNFTAYENTPDKKKNTGLFIGFLASIGLQILLAKLIIPTIVFYFTFDNYGTGIRPYELIYRREVILVLFASALLFRYEYLYLFRRHRLSAFAEKHPIKAKSFLYRASQLVLAAYVIGALSCMVNGVNFLFTTVYGLDAFLLYNISLAICVVPVILAPAALIYFLRNKKEHTGDKGFLRNLIKALMPCKSVRIAVIAFVAYLFLPIDGSQKAVLFMFLIGICIMAYITAKYIRHLKAVYAQDSKELMIRIGQDKADK